MLPTASQAINRKKWTPELMRAGWVLLPNVLIEKQKELGLSALELNIILHLAAHWWVADVHPCPSMARMAAAIGVTTKTIQRSLTALHHRNLVKRTVRGTVDAPRTTNSYDLSGLIKAATPLADQMAIERASKRKPVRPKPLPFEEVSDFAP